MNIAIVVGHLSSAPVEQVLPSGDLIAKLEVTVREPGLPTATVPVVVHGPNRDVRALDAGQEVVVVGSVRRRFFRAGAGTGSRTEVVAQRVARSGRRREAARMLAAASEAVGATVGERGWDR